MVWSEDVTNRICLFCDGIGGPSRKLTQGTCKFAVVCRWGKIRSKKNNVNTQILVCVGHFDTRRQWKVYYRRFMIGPSAQWLIGVFCISKRTKYLRTCCSRIMHARKLFCDSSLCCERRISETKLLEAGKTTTIWRHQLWRTLDTRCQPYFSCAFGSSKRAE